MNDLNDERNDDAELRDASELTAAEKEALEKLKRSRRPSPALEDRLVDMLRKRGVLAPTRRRVIVLTSWRIAVATAACLALLVVGFAAGQLVGARQAAGDAYTTRESGDISVAAILQQTGSAYLLALQRLADLPDTVDVDQGAQGREVALTTLYAAADRVGRLVPKDELAGQLLFAIDSDPAARASGGQGEAVVEGEQVIEF